MRRKLLSRVSLVACGALVVACTAPSQDDAGERTDRISDAIIGGTYDTTHEAVVAVAQTQGLCSGTLVKVDPATGAGWVLTAAHCVATPPQVVLQGPDYEDKPLYYKVVGYAAHPGYTGAVDSSYDFAVVRVIGTDATTPTIPALASAQDNLSAGKSVTSVGYGKTQTADTPKNSRRKRITLNVGQVSTNKLSFGFAGGGTCQGDSGGPVLYVVGGKEYVAGVHSYVVGDCTQGSVSGRIAPSSAWLQGELAKTPTGDACGLCRDKVFYGKNACALDQAACLAGTACKGFVDCLKNCSTPGACQAECEKRFPLGVGPQVALETCECRAGCAATCGPAICGGAAKCGYRLKAGDCQACLESSCCGEVGAAAKDGLGYQCLQSGGTYAGCGANEPYQKLAVCRKKCSACTGVIPEPTVDPEAPVDPAAEPAPPAAPEKQSVTTTRSGCSAAAGAMPMAWWPVLAALGVALLARRRLSRSR